MSTRVAAAIILTLLAVIVWMSVGDAPWERAPSTKTLTITASDFELADPPRLGPSDLTLPVRCGVPFTATHVLQKSGWLLRFDDVPPGTEIVAMAEGTEDRQDRIQRGKDWFLIRYQLPGGHALLLYVSSSAVLAPAATQGEAGLTRAHRSVNRGDPVAIIKSDIEWTSDDVESTAEWDGASFLVASSGGTFQGCIP